MKTYRYKFRVDLAILTIIFFSACGWIITQVALDQDSIFLAVVAIAAWLFVLYALLLLSVGFIIPQHIILTPESIIVPKGLWSKETQRIDLEEITSIEYQDQDKTRMLMIYHSCGMFMLLSSRLSNHKMFSEICSHLNVDDVQLEEDIKMMRGSSQLNDLSHDYISINDQYLDLFDGSASKPLREKREKKIISSLKSMSSYWFIFWLKLLTLLSFCGGPLYLLELIEPLIGELYAFLLTLTPNIFIMLALLSIKEDEPSTVVLIIAYLGKVSGFLLFLMSLFIMFIKWVDVSLPYVDSLNLCGAFIGVGYAWISIKITSTFQTSV